MGRELTEQDKSLVSEMLNRANAAMSEIEDCSQEQLDRLAQAMGWYAGTETTFTRLTQMGVDESGIGDREGAPVNVSKSTEYCAMPCASQVQESSQLMKQRVL